MERALELHAWQQAHGARFENSEPAAEDSQAPEAAKARDAMDYGDPLEEYAAARTGVALFDLSNRDLIRLRGEDRVSFLHGMVTQDVTGLAVGHSAYAAFLTAKGAMVADARILKRPEDLLLDTEPGRGAPVREFLERYLVSEDVELETVTDLALLALRGPSTQTLLQTWNPKIPVLAAEAAQAFPLRSSEEGPDGWAIATPTGVDLLVPNRLAQEVAEGLLRAGAAYGLRLAGKQAQEWLRVEAGVPRYGQDMDEKTIPLEANLQRAIHYQKGCYIGQEVIARATYRGHMNRKLVGLLLGENRPAPHAELKVGDRKVGWVTSVIRSPALKQEIALGYVHRDFLTPGTALQLAESGASVTVAELPFVKSA
jgi:aminomethyltransferase